jgi:hypothetical protein
MALLASNLLPASLISVEFPLTHTSLDVDQQPYPISGPENETTPFQLYLLLQKICTYPVTLASLIEIFGGIRFSYLSQLLRFVIINKTQRTLE